MKGWARALLVGVALQSVGCYTSHTTYVRATGTLTRTVAFGPAATVRIEGAKVEATTSKAPGAAMAGGAFLGSAIGSFFRARF
jgi:outer membrane lipoprotein SlyB